MFSGNPLRKPQGSGESGFTLVEFLVVSMILFLLAALSLPIIAGSTEKARVARSATELRTIEQALDLYYERLGHYPQNLGELVRDGYLKQTSFESPWSSPSNPIFFFYAVDFSGEGKAKAYALGDPGSSGAQCGKTWDWKDAVFSSDPTQPLPCGRKPFGTKAAYIMGEELKENDMPLFDSNHNALTFKAPYLSGVRPADIRTNR